RLDGEAALQRDLDRYACALDTRGEFARSEQLRTELLARHRASLGNENPQIAADLSALAAELMRHGQGSAAAPLLVECLEIRKKLGPPDDPLVRSAERQLAACRQVASVPRP